MRTIGYATRKMLLVPVIGLLLLTACQAQQQHKPGRNHSEVKPQPELKVQVHKETDANGNIVRYDSVYSYSFSSGMAPDAWMETHRQFMKDISSWNWSVPMLYPDSVWRSLIRSVDLGITDRATWQLMQSVHEALKKSMRVPPQRNNIFQPVVPEQPVPGKKTGVKQVQTTRV